MQIMFIVIVVIFNLYILFNPSLCIDRVKLPPFFKALYFQDMGEIRTLHSMDFAWTQLY